MSRKELICKILEQGPLKNIEILEQLSKRGLSSSKATLNRDLRILIQSEQVITIGSGRSVKYQLRANSPLTKNYNLETYFQEHFATRQILETFNDDIFNLLEEEQDKIFTQAELNLCSEYQQNYQQKIQDIDPYIYKRELERLTIDLAWKSSSIEGNTYSVLETESLIKTGEEARGHNRVEALMILNHKQALDYIHANQEQYSQLDSETIIELHHILSKDLNIPQGIRSAAIGISGSRYRPVVLKSNVEFQLKQCSKLINQINQPITKAITALALIAYLQAFNDGNKRTSRMLANALLINAGYCPLSFATVQESDYKQALLLFYEQNSLVELKKIFIEQLSYASKHYF